MVYFPLQANTRGTPNRSPQQFNKVQKGFPKKKAHKLATNLHRFSHCCHFKSAVTETTVHGDLLLLKENTNLAFATTYTSRAKDQQLLPGLVVD